MFQIHLPLLGYHAECQVWSWECVFFLDNNPVMCTHDWACVYACAYWSLLPKNYPPLLFPLVIIWSMDVGLRIVMLSSIYLILFESNALIIYWACFEFLSKLTFLA